MQFVNIAAVKLDHQCNRLNSLQWKRKKGSLFFFWLITSDFCCCVQICCCCLQILTNSQHIINTQKAAHLESRLRVHLLKLGAGHPGHKSAVCPLSHRHCTSWPLKRSWARSTNQYVVLAVWASAKSFRKMEMSFPVKLASRQKHKVL